MNGHDASTRVLVTGASGFLGRRVVARLLGSGVRVRCLVRSSESGDALARELEHHSRGATASLELHVGTLNSPEACAQAVAGCGTVYHVAAGTAGSAAVL